MASAKEHIMKRLRVGGRQPFAHAEGAAGQDGEWLARQPPLGDLAARFLKEQQEVGSRVLQVPTWEALPQAVAPWFAELGIASAMTGAVPRLEPLRRHLAGMGIAVRTYVRPQAEQREELFGTDCGITTSLAAIAETGSIVLLPTPQEPRLLSLAMPVHLVLVERAALLPRLRDFILSGRYQREVPSNLVLVSGASRTADIEMTLAMGVHGPKTLLVALIG